MVRRVDYRQVDIGFRQDSADVRAAETAANHHDFGPCTCRRALVQLRHFHSQSVGAQLDGGEGTGTTSVDL